MKSARHCTKAETQTQTPLRAPKMLCLFLHALGTLTCCKLVQRGQTALKQNQACNSHRRWWFVKASYTVCLKILNRLACAPVSERTISCKESVDCRCQRLSGQTEPPAERVRNSHALDKHLVEMAEDHCAQSWFQIWFQSRLGQAAIGLELPGWQAGLAQAWVAAEVGARCGRWARNDAGMPAHHADEAQQVPGWHLPETPESSAQLHPC